MVYSRAPILEAVLDIQVKLSSLPAESVFKAIATDLEGTFPVHVETNQVRLSVIMGPSTTGQPVTSAQQLGGGQRLTNTANDRILVVMSRGMSFSHLAPYSRWDQFREEAISAWQKYVEHIKPEGVMRVALRYINRIWVPSSAVQLQDYFNLYPELPDTAPISQFFMQVQVPQPDLGNAMAVVNLSSAGIREDQAQGIMLDIDVFAVEELAVDEEVVFARLDQLRLRKNELFESYITDKSRELFK